MPGLGLQLSENRIIKTKNRIAVYRHQLTKSTAHLFSLQSRPRLAASHACRQRAVHHVEAKRALPGSSGSRIGGRWNCIRYFARLVLPRGKGRGTRRRVMGRGKIDCVAAIVSHTARGQQHKLSCNLPQRARALTNFADMHVGRVVKGTGHTSPVASHPRRRLWLRWRTWGRRRKWRLFGAPTHVSTMATVTVQEENRHTCACLLARAPTRPGQWRLRSPRPPQPAFGSRSEPTPSLSAGSRSRC